MVVAALVAALVFSGPVVAPSPTPPSAPVAVFTVTTANVRVTLGDARARADVRRATRGASVVLLQEMWHRHAGRMAPAGWSSYQPGRPAPTCRGQAVLWRRATWQLIRHRAVVLAYSRAFPTATRCVSVVVLRHRATGLVVPVVDVHMGAHVEVAGHPRPLPVRVGVYAAGMARLHELAYRVRTYRGRVLLGGDFNVDFRADRLVGWPGFPWAHLRPRYDSNWGKLPSTRPTHGTRRIDAVWWSERDGLRPVDSDTIGGTYSDHNFVRVTLAGRRG